MLLERSIKLQKRVINAVIYRFNDLSFRHAMLRNVTDCCAVIL